MLKIKKISLITFCLLLIILFLILFFNKNSVGRKPELYDLSNSVVAPGDTITLYGNYFGSGISQGRVFINDKMIFKEFIQSWNNREIVLTLSENFTSGMLSVNNMYGDSSPYLVTSENDVPDIKIESLTANIPLIKEIKFIDRSRLKVRIQGESFGLFNTNTGLIIKNSEGFNLNLDKSSIIEWSDDQITFFLPNTYKELELQVINYSGLSNEFKLDNSETLPVTYIFDDFKKYSIIQSVNVLDVITLGDGLVNVFMPCVYEDQKQKDVEFQSLKGKYNSSLNIFEYNIMFKETGDSDLVKLETTVEIGSMDTKIRTDLIGRLYDSESPYYKNGFIEIPGVDKNDTDIKNTGVWLIRNTSNRYKQTELLVDWILKYIKKNSESSDVSAVAFKNRSASENGLINITVSMLRSVGIPSRVVSGIKIEEEVLNYRWLEFYLPYGGWVPIDLIKISLDKSYEIGRLENNIIGFTKGVTYIDYQTDNFKNGFYALQNSTSNFGGNIESYEILWHNVEIK